MALRLKEGNGNQWLSWLVRGHLGKFKIKFSQSMAVFSGMIIIFLKKKSCHLYNVCLAKHCQCIYFTGSWWWSWVVRQDEYSHFIGEETEKLKNFEYLLSFNIHYTQEDAIISMYRCVMEKEMATHSSILAWRIPGMEESGGLPLWGHTESDTTEVT